MNNKRLKASHSCSCDQKSLEYPFNSSYFIVKPKKSRSTLLENLRLCETSIRQFSQVLDQFSTNSTGIFVVIITNTDLWDKFVCGSFPGLRLQYHCQLLSRSEFLQKVPIRPKNKEPSASCDCSTLPLLIELDSPSLPRSSSSKVSNSNIPMENTKVPRLATNPTTQKELHNTTPLETFSHSDQPLPQVFSEVPRRHPAYATPRNIRADLKTVLFRPTTDKLLCDLSKTVLGSALAKLTPAPLFIRPLRDGGIAADFTPSDSVDLHLTVNVLSDVPVFASFPRPVSLSCGTISGEFASPEELQALYNLHASDNAELISVYRIGSSNTFRLNFKENRPEKVKIFYTCYSIKPFFQCPRRCYNCHRFTHLATKCKFPQTCGKCGKPGHAYKDCSSITLTCANCGEDHSTHSPECSHYRFYLQVSKKSANLQCSRKEAHVSLAKSYAEAAAQSTYQIQPTSSSGSPAVKFVPFSELPELFAKVLTALFPNTPIELSVIREAMASVV